MIPNPSGEKNKKMAIIKSKIRLSKLCVSLIFLATILLGVYFFAGRNVQDLSDNTLMIKYLSIKPELKERTNAAAVNLAFMPINIATNGTYTISDTVKVNLVVSSPDQAMNTVGGNIIFDPKKLQLISVTTSGSIVNLWVTDPSGASVTATNGTISFMGGVTAPGFMGNQGQVLSVSFKVIGSGQTSIGVTDPQVLANDGLGTDLLSTATPSQLMLKNPVPPILPVASDVNSDGKVDLADLSVVLANYGKTIVQSSPAMVNSSDINGDGKVDIKDISIILSKFTAKK